MAQFSPEKAFALTDHPFSPTKALPGMTDENLVNEVVSYPLRIHQDEHLEKLFSYGAGPFRKHLEDFQNLIGVQGYVDGEGAGTARFAFVITGPGGTGKTTLVNRLMCHLKKCRPPGTPDEWWKIFDPWSNQILAVEPQLAALRSLKEQIDGDTGPGDHICVVLDNLVSGVEAEAINLFNDLRQTRAVFLFLITSDDALVYQTLPDGTKVARTWDNYAAGFHLYQTEELQPAQAIQYVKDRLNFYRAKDAEGKPLFPECPLFPLDADDLTLALTKQAGLGVSILNLRQLNQHLSTTLRQEMVKKSKDYDVRKLTLAQLAQEIIYIVDRSFERMAA